MLVERKTSNNNKTSEKIHRAKFGAFLHSEPASFYTNSDDGQGRISNVSAASPRTYNGDCSTPTSSSNNASPSYMLSPWNQEHNSPLNKSPWQMPSSEAINLFHDHHHHQNNNNGDDDAYYQENGLIGSLVREEGHIYSLALSGDLLYTGSDSKNIRVWKDLKDYTGFKSNSGLVKTIVISEGNIFTGHQDGKIRVWKNSSKNSKIHKRVGSLPTFKDYVKSSMNPKNYVEVRRRRNTVKVKHFDAISSLSLNQEQGLLYSASWDKSFKVWRVGDFKCLESINAHDDAVNAVVAAFQSYVFTGSADGTVKMWKRETDGKGKKTKHVLDRILLKQEIAVTALTVNRLSTVIYCGSSDGLVNFWEYHQKNNLTHGGVLKGHKLAVLCLTAANNLLFSGSADKNVCVWKREQSGAHTCLSVLTGHTGPVKCIAVEEHEEQDRCVIEKSDQRWIVYTGSLDKSVKVWRVSEHAPDLRLMQEWTSPIAPKGYDSPAIGLSKNRKI